MTSINHHKVLQEWRIKDQADSITLSRYEVIQLCEEYNELLESRQQLYGMVMI